jgi:hypothetical protein
MNQETRNQDRTTPSLFAGAGAALIVVGAFLPWAVVRAALLGQISKAGTEGDGVFTLIGGLVVAGLTFWFFSRGNALGVGVAVIAALVGALALWDTLDVQSRFSSLNSTYAQGSVGSGLYVTIVGAIGAFIGGVMMSRVKGPAPATPDRPDDEGRPDPTLP